MMAKIKKEPITRAERGRNEIQEHFHDGGNQEEHKVCRDWSLLAALPAFVSWTLWISRSTRWGHHSPPRPPTLSYSYSRTLRFRTESMKMFSTYDLLQYPISTRFGLQDVFTFSRALREKFLFCCQAVKESGFPINIID